ncbi:hypothetical protein NDU88_002832 [Pleurodeles waltl]|uniref:Uncharacterized protein n=1 Tax=Pleurodeles waltl TaxID=8319 RepID=A0AAV7UWS0_PLEWA|nr:hypothetical protein NDU88_002832 [Pleurodeles waltl]
MRGGLDHAQQQQRQTLHRPHRPPYRQRQEAHKGTTFHPWFGTRRARVGEALIPPSSSSGRRCTDYAAHLTVSARRCIKVPPSTRSASHVEHTWGGLDLAQQQQRQTLHRPHRPPYRQWQEAHKGTTFHLWRGTRRARVGEALIPPSSGRRCTGYCAHLTGSARRSIKTRSVDPIPTTLQSNGSTHLNLRSATELQPANYIFSQAASHRVMYIRRTLSWCTSNHDSAYKRKWS